MIASPPPQTGVGSRKIHTYKHIHIPSQQCSSAAAAVERILTDRVWWVTV